MNGEIMSDFLNIIILSILFGLLISTITVILDHLIPISNKLIHLISRMFATALFIIGLLVVLSNPYMSIKHNNITIDYNMDKGLELSGSFKDKYYRSMYILVREEKKGDPLIVWTTVAKVFDIDHQRSTWSSRIYLSAISKKVLPGSKFYLIGVMTKDNIKPATRIFDFDISNFDGYKTSILHLTIRNVNKNT